VELHQLRYVLPVATGAPPLEHAGTGDALGGSDLSSPEPATARDTSGATTAITPGLRR